MAERVPPPFVARPPLSAPARPRAGPATAGMLEPAAAKHARHADHRLGAPWPRRPCAALLAAALVLAGGIGAATAEGAARDTLSRLASSGGSEHAVPYLGLLLGGTVPDDQVIGLGLSDTELGRVVTSVDPGSPADRARIRWGDLILRADGHAIRSPRDLDGVLRRSSPGTSLQLVIRRGQETLETTIVVGELPPAFIEHGVGPIFDRDPSCAQLPAGRTEADNLPIANWVGWGNPAIQRGGLEVGVLITSLNGREVRSITEFYEAASPVRLGDDVVVRFRSHGRERQLSYLAQAPPLPESRLRLEEITPTLVESESLSTSEAERGGLFVRRVEPGSAAQRAGLRAGDRILAMTAEPTTTGLDSAAARRVIAQADSAAMQPLTSVAQFDSIHAAIPWPFVSRLRVARRGTAEEVLRLERDWRRTIRERPSGRSGGWWDFEVLPITGRPDVIGVIPFNTSPVSAWFKVAKGLAIPAPLPVLWTKVTGPCFGGRTGFWWDASRHSGWNVIQPGAETWDAPTLRMDWRWSYGLGDKRWHHRVDLVKSGNWGPRVTYLDEPQSFYHEEIGSVRRAFATSMFLGEDKLRYTHARGWSLGWDVGLPRLPGHRVQLTFARIQESPLAGVSTSSLFGRDHFTPNPTRGVTSGLRNSVTLRYSFANTRWRTWSRTFVEAEVRAAGGSLEGDFDFARWEANAARSFRLTRRLYLDNRVRAGLATGRLPLQEEFYAGGSGTLPGYADFRFTGDRTLLGRTRLSVVPLGLPEQGTQFRVFAGIDAGNAWQSDGISGVPRLQTDFAFGAGLFYGYGDEVFFPSSLSVAWARPLDRGFGRWRLQWDLYGGARR